MSEIKCIQKELTGFFPPLSFQCSGNYLWIILGNESLHKLMLYLVREDWIKMKCFSPYSQSETVISSIHPDTFKIWNWRITPRKNYLLVSSIPVKFIRERPGILILSIDLRLHGNRGPSFQDTGRKCRQLNNGKPKLPTTLWNIWWTTLLLERTDLPTSCPKWT